MNTNETLNDRFQVNLSELIEILSRHLYSSGPEVFVRELLQNASDAVTARSALGEPVDPSIKIQVCQGEEGGLSFSIRNNGIGLGSEDISQCLATIGFSSKSPSGSSAPAKFIG